MLSFENLDEKIREKGLPVCLGLDPHIDLIPQKILEKNYKKYGKTPKGASRAILEFNKGILDTSHDLIPCIKPQIAFYEKWGSEGIYALEKTLEYARKLDIFIIMDAKRSDIGSTSKAYAETYFSEKSPLESDALTVVPYFGDDGILPFLEMAKIRKKNIFIMAFSTNPSGYEIQNPIKEILIEKINNYKNEYGNIGAVVGLTQKNIEEIRKKMKGIFFLVPGYGAQGGEKENLKKVFEKGMKNAIVSASRSIIFAYKKTGEDYKKATRYEIMNMKKDFDVLSW